MWLNRGVRWAAILRRAALLTGAIALVWMVGQIAGSRPAAAAAAVLAASSLVVLVLMPRLAHRAFRAGRFTRARLAYGVLRWLRLDSRVRAALDVSLAACLIGRERYQGGLAVLARVDPEVLGESARAAWLNNRAYARLRAGDDPAEALADVDRAIALRPDVVGFRHTRGLAFLELGRLEEAIRELEAPRAPSSAPRGPAARPSAASPLAGRDHDLPVLLEAERCFDLGLAWSRRGEADYAADYFERACRVAPGSRWAARAAARLQPSARMPDALTDLV